MMFIARALGFDGMPPLIAAMHAEQTDNLKKTSDKLVREVEELERELHRHGFNADC